MERLEILTDSKSYGAKSPSRSVLELPKQRAFGSVTDAVVQVLEEAGTALSYIEIYRAVNERLGGEVSKSSVKNALVRAASSKDSEVVRVRHGRYRRG